MTRAVDGDFARSEARKTTVLGSDEIEGENATR